MLISDGGPPSPATLIDPNMLVMLTGKERTADDFGALREMQTSCAGTPGRRTASEHGASSERVACRAGVDGILGWRIRESTASRRSPPPRPNATTRIVDGSSQGSVRAGTRPGSPAGDAAMTRYAAGDEAAFAVLYDELSPRLYAFLLRHTRDVGRSEDVLQQTFLQIHRARDAFIPGAEVLPWALAIARRLMIDSFRRGPREALEDGDARLEPAALDARADDLVLAQELASRMQRELARMPVPQRVAFELVKQEGLSHAEAAKALGTTVNAVKLRAHRAYDALRAVLRDVADDGAGRKQGT